jgi:hypothetical protein
MPNAVFLNDRQGRFVDGGPTAGAAFARKAVHRGSAVGDVDNDGRLDVVVTAVDGALELWRNVSPAKNHWLSVAVEGVKGNRDGMGAQLTLVTAAGTQHDVVNTAVGYGSASDARVHFGLGAETTVRELKVVWPTRQTTTLRNVAADQVLKVRPPK